MNRTPLEVKPEHLRHAPWNPRAKITPEDVEDLSASIRTDGLIQRLAVIVDPEKVRGDDGFMRYVVIAGNRRLVACIQAGVKEIPCELLDVDLATAKKMTLIENLQRKDVDPLMEASLIKGLTEEGMTIEQIAAETGRGEKWVWRRQQLVELSAKWRSIVEKSEVPFSVDCLEHIARYTLEVQNAAAEEFKTLYRSGDIWKWNSLSSTFNGLTRDLKDVKFSRKSCTHCPNNSANAPMLFDVDPMKNGKPAKWGRCLCSSCFAGKMKEYVDIAKETAKKFGHDIVEVKYSYDVPRSWSATDEPTDENKVLYVWNVNGYQGCSYSVPKQTDSVRTGPSEEEKAERKRKKAVKAACGKMSAYISREDDTFLDMVVARFCSFADTGLKCLRAGNAIALGCAFDMRDFDSGTSIQEECAARLEVDTVGEYLEGDDLRGFIDELRQAVCAGLEGYYAEKIARYVLRIFVDMRVLLTEDERKLLEV